MVLQIISYDFDEILPTQTLTNIISLNDEERHMLAASAIERKLLPLIWQKRSLSGYRNLLVLIPAVYQILLIYSYIYKIGFCRYFNAEKKNSLNSRSISHQFR